MLTKEYIEKKIQKMGKDELVSTLTPREWKIITLRFGFDDEKEHSLQEIGNSLGITRERVRQILGKTEKKLEHYRLRCGAPLYESENSWGQCPVCGRPLNKHQGKKGPFVACSGFPVCKYVNTTNDEQ